MEIDHEGGRNIQLIKNSFNSGRNTSYRRGLHSIALMSWVRLRCFDVQSIKTETFSVNVNLDLPETGSAIVPTIVQTQPVIPAKLSLTISGNDMSINDDGEQVETKENKTEQVYSTYPLVQPIPHCSFSAFNC